jgi:thiamine biosynthesis protein ThiS
VIALKVNGKVVQHDGPTPHLVYLEKLGVSPRAVAVEHNAVIIERDAYATTTLADGDTVEIVKMVGGGRSGPGRTVYPPRPTRRLAPPAKRRRRVGTLS